jgi:hypothetical protein
VHWPLAARRTLSGRWTAMRHARAKTISRPSLSSISIPEEAFRGLRVGQKQRGRRLLDDEGVGRSSRAMLYCSAHPFRRHNRADFSQQRFTVRARPFLEMRQVAAIRALRAVGTRGFGVGARAFVERCHIPQ